MKKSSFDYFLLTTLIILLPFERLLTFELAGFTVKPSYIVAIIYVLLKFSQIISGKIHFRFRGSEWVMLAMLVLSYLSALWSLDAARSLVMSTILLLMFATYLSVSRSVDGSTSGKIANIVVILGSVLSLFAIVQFIVEPISGYRMALLRVEYGSGVFGFPRPQATFLEPLYFANFLIWPIFLQLSKLRKSVRLTDYLYLVAMLTAFVLTLSRGAYLALLVGLVLVFLFLLVKKIDKKLFLSFFASVLTALLVSAVLVVSIAGSKGLQTFYSHAISSTDLPAQNQKELLKSRKYSSNLSSAEIKSHPWLGLGYDAYGALPEFDLLRQSGNWQTVNNEYLELLVGLGFLGLLLFVWLILALLKFLYSRVRLGQLEYIFYSGAVVAVLVQYLTFSSLNLLYLWVMLAIITPASLKQKNGQSLA